MKTAFNDFNKINESNTNEKVLFSSNTPTDIIICGTMFDDTSDFMITDDYYDFNVTINGSKEMEYGTESDGFVTIVGLDEFMKNTSSKIEGFDKDKLGGIGVESILVHNFIGDAKLRVNVDGIGYIDTINISSSDLIMYDTQANNKDFSVDVDINHGEIFDLDTKLYDMIENNPEELKEFFDTARKNKSRNKFNI